MGRAQKSKILSKAQQNMVNQKLVLNKKTKRKKRRRLRAKKLIHSAKNLKLIGIDVGGEGANEGVVGGGVGVKGMTGSGSSGTLGGRRRTSST